MALHRLLLRHRVLTITPRQTYKLPVNPMQSPPPLRSLPPVKPVTREAERLKEQARRRVDTTADFHPAYVVWELTLRCNHACAHCGSRAQQPREGELTTEAALKVVQALAALGTREVVLIGGEAYLHPGFLEVVAALSVAGITPVMTTGGMGIRPALARDMADAGLRRVSVSIDGLEATHNRIRRHPGSFQSALKALESLQAAGLDISANTHFNRWNESELEDMYKLLQPLGVRSWQIQITAALGRAADRPEMLFQPWDLLQFLPRVAQLKRQAYADGILIMPGNNLGYFGPEEALLRSLKLEHKDAFQGCQAGRFVMGIESHGAVKGCPSLQSKSYTAGNLRETALADIWATGEALQFRRTDTDYLWGYCAECPFAQTCQGGCSFTAHALFGKPGNNPYCHFRARHFQKQGLRERLVPLQAAEGQPFDHGLFEIVLEPFTAAEPEGLISERPLPMV